MANLFLALHARQAPCARKLGSDLNKAGHDIVARRKGGPVREIEHEILRSSAIIVVWSADAESQDWIRRAIVTARKLVKPVFMITSDLAVPESEISPSTAVINTDATCSNAAAALLPRLSELPGSDLEEAARLLTHEHGEQRQRGIEAAAKLCGQAPLRERALAMLEYVASMELISAVKGAAQAALNKAVNTPATPPSPDESVHIVAVKCPEDHTNYLDRRIVCKSDAIKRLRGIPGKDVQELRLHCQCGLKLKAMIDCGGYT